MVAEIFIAFVAEPAFPAGRVDPGDTDPVPGFECFYASSDLVHNTNYLMSRYYGKFRRRCPPLNFIQFSMTDTAHRNLHENLIVIRYGGRHINKSQRLFVLLEIANPVDYHGLHNNKTGFKF